MSFNIKSILKRSENKRPKNIFEYILHLYNDSIYMIPIYQTALFNHDVYVKLSEYTWFVYIESLTTDFPMPISNNTYEHANSNIINDYIFNNYSKYDFLPKITEFFTFDDFSETDREYMRTYINGIVENLLLKNAEKYEKLFTAMTAEFNPLWNVDGTETTIRTLERDGTETTAKTGTVTDATTGTETTATTGTDETVRTGTETDAKSGYDSLGKTGTVATAKTGTETTKGTGTDTTVKNGQENKTIDTSKASFNSSTLQPTESVTDDTQYTNIQEQETKDLTDTLTHNTTDTTTHNTTDTQNYNSSNTLTRNTTDTRTANLQDQTTHNTTDTTTHNTTDQLTLDTIDTERIEHIRQGNIGVTTTTKLLTEYVDFAEYVDFIKTISHDIVSELCYLV